MHALAAIEQHEPDVVVMDLHMPQMGGVETTRRLLRSRPQTAVLVLTMFDDEESVFAAVSAGARGYLLKGTDRDGLRAAVCNVANGHAVFGPGVAARVLDRLTGNRATTPAFPSLTAREHEVLEAMVGGHQVSAIALRLGLNEKTVRNNISSILTKLQVADRATAIGVARAAGVGGASSAQRRVLACTQVDHSARLADELGPAYRSVLSAHNEIVGAAFTRNGGSPFGALGTIRAAWFRDLDGAVAALLDIQHDLAARPLPAGATVSVRAGIHAGAVLEHDGEIVGLAVQEVARIADHTRAGQILISAEALDREPPAGRHLVDTGTHDLRDIDRPLRLYAVTPR